MNKKIKVIDLALGGLEKMSRSCELCMHKCGARRFDGEIGACNAGATIEIFSYGPHHGEEPPLSGTRGSGTIFFSHCSLKCVYCQNYKFSQLKHKEEDSFEKVQDSISLLAEKMLELEKSGCHNINLVSPTHYLYQIALSLKIAFKKGLSLPIVYNTGGYDNLEAIKLLDGIVDVYLPDMRYSDDKNAVDFSGASGYVANNRLLVKEMFRQRGEFVTIAEGVVSQGLIVRLLVLPGNLSGTSETLKFLKRNISEDAFISLMSQYHPVYQAKKYKVLNRRINNAEYNEILDAVYELGLTNGWIQGFHERPDHFFGTNINPLNS